MKLDEFLRLIQLLQKHRHFFLGLLVAMGLSRCNPLLPCRPRCRTIPRRQLRLAQQLPGRRILGVKADATLQMLRRFQVIPKVQIALAQAKAQQ